MGPSRQGVVPVLRGAGVLPLAVRTFRHRPESLHHAGVDRRGLGRRWRVLARCWPTGWPASRGGWSPTSLCRPRLRPARSHYGFAPDFCRANDPQSKGIVENLCGYAQRDLAVPFADRGCHRRCLSGSAGANAAVAAWCAEVNATAHSEIHAIPDDRLIAERELLQPPRRCACRSVRPRCYARSTGCRVCATVGPYSVPTRLIGATVAVVVDHGAVCLLERATGVIVAEHELIAPGSASILDEHYDGPRPAPSRGPRPKTSVEKRFCDLGRTRKRSWSVPRRSATLAWVRSWRSCSPSGPRTAPTPWWWRCTGRWHSAGSGPLMCDPSWPPARELNSPARPVTPCRGSTGRSDPFLGRLQDRLGRRRRGDLVTKTAPLTDTKPVAPRSVPSLDADLDAGLRRLKLAAIRRTAPEVLITAKTQRWTPEECCGPWSRPNSPHAMPPTSSTGSRPPHSPSENPGLVRRGRLLDPTQRCSTTCRAWNGYAHNAIWRSSAPPEPASPTLIGLGTAAIHAGKPEGPLLRRRRPRGDALPRTGRQHRRQDHRVATAGRPDHSRRARIRTLG